MIPAEFVLQNALLPGAALSCEFTDVGEIVDGLFRADFPARESGQHPASDHPPFRGFVEVVNHAGDIVFLFLIVFGQGFSPMFYLLNKQVMSGMSVLSR